MLMRYFYLDRIGLLGVIMIFSYLSWLFYKLLPLSEFNFFNTNSSKPISKFFITDTIKHIPQVGFDKSDRQLHIVIDILDQKFTWMKNEITIGEYIYEDKVIDLREYFRDQLYLDKINKSTEIICLGNASFEESLAVPVERRKSEEETRASIRAHHLQNIIKSLLTNPETPVYILNLGKHKFEKPPSSNMQRSIVIVRILAKETGVNINEALHNALINSLEMPFKVTDFSLIKNDSVKLSIK